MSNDQRYTLWDKIWKDRDGKVIIAQMPNAWLLAWAVLVVALIFVPHGTTYDILRWARSVILSAWATLEILTGVNYFRRALGLVILAVTIAGVVSSGS